MTGNTIFLICLSICALSWSITGLATAWAKWKESQSWVDEDNDKEDWWKSGK